jgi:hypothetical protein
MKKFLLKILMCIWLLSICVPNTMWGELTVYVPIPKWPSDINIQWSTSVNTDRTELIDIIKIINKYLWFSLWLIAMIIFVYAWILLIAWWKKDSFDKANKMLLWAGVAIVISMLSYTVVNLLINLF